MSLYEFDPMLQLTARPEPTAATDLLRPVSPFAMLKELSAESEGFASGTTLISRALQSRFRVIIAANMTREEFALSQITCWHCTYDDQGIDLLPDMHFSSTSTFMPAELWADLLLEKPGSGDVLVVCDPWGDNELLCRAVRVASLRRIATIAITTDQPNLLAVLAHHSVRVPVTEPFRREFVITALRHLVQTAAVSLVPTQRRVTGPLRDVTFD